MRKLRIKTKLRLVVLALLAVLVITVAGNVALFSNRDMIASAVNGHLDYDIAIGSVCYLFPNRVVIFPVRVRKNAFSIGPSSLMLSGVAVRFSAWDFISSGKVIVNAVEVYSSEVSYFVLSKFLEDNYQKILEIIRNASGESMNVRVRETLLNFDRDGHPDYIAMQLYLDVRRNRIEGTGLFRADRYSAATEEGDEPVRRTAKGWPLWYRIGGELKPDGIQVDQLLFSSGNFFAKYWGSLQSGTLKFQGFTLMDTTRQNPDESGRSLTYYINRFPEESELAHVDTYILDVDAKVRLAYPVVEVERVDFTLNNTPVTVSGSLSLLDPLTIDAGIALRTSRSQAGWSAYVDSAGVKFHGALKGKTLTTNGHADFDFKDSESGLVPDIAKFTFKDLSFHQDPARRGTLSLSAGDIVYFSNGNEHKISVNEFKAVSAGEMDGHKTIELSGPFYGGAFTGRVWFDATQIRPKITALILLSEVNTDALEEVLVHFAKFNGRMSGKLNFTNSPGLDLSGDISVRDGRLTDFDFFNWVADSFSLPAMRAIDFERGSAQFTINKDHVLLHDIRLHTDDVRIGGYYEISPRGLVTSELSLNLSRALLNQSEIFKTLLRTYRKDDSHLNFDFRLSGNVDAVNFQWLPSEVKRQIQKRIPDFIERKIEQDVDDMMEPAP